MGRPAKVQSPLPRGRAIWQEKAGKLQIFPPYFLHSSCKMCTIREILTDRDDVPAAIPFLKGAWL